MALSDHAFTASHGHLGPFIASDDDLFIVGHGGTDQVEVLRSADDGSTWGTPVATTAGRNVNAISAFQSGDTLYVAWGTVTYTSGMSTLYDVEYQEFNMASNSWSGSVDTVDSPDVTDQGLSFDNNAPGIVRRSSDTVILYIGSEQADMGTGYRNVSYARGTAGSWSSVDNLVSQAVGGVNYYPIGAEPSSQAGECHFFWKRDTTAGNEENARTLRSDNSLSTSVTGTSANGLESGTHALVAWDDAGTWRIANVLASGTVVTITRWNEDGSNDIAHTDRQTSGINDSATATAVHYRKSIAVDPNGDDVYVLWDGTDADLFYDSSANAASGGWGTDVEAEDAVTVGSGQSANGYTRGASSHVIGYIFDNDATGDTVFGEISLGAGAQNITSVGTTQLAAGVNPTKLNMQIQHTLVQQLTAGVEPSVAALITAALTQQLATGLAPQANMQIQQALVQQLLAGVDPNVAIQQFITTVLEQQLAAGFEPSLAASITAALVQQLVAGIDPQLAVTIQTAVAAELVAGIDPALALVLSPALSQQLAAGVEPGQLQLTVTAALVQQLLSPFDPTVIGSQDIDPAVAQQLIAAIDPQLNHQLVTALAQQLAAGIEPTQLNLQVVAALAQQLATGVDPQVNMSIIAAVLQQFAAGINPVDVTLSGGTQTITDPSATQLLAGIDPQLNLAFQTALVVQTLQGIAPQLNITIDPALEQQLATGTEPTQLWRTIVTALEQQLAAGVDPSVAFGITTAIAQQLATGIDPTQLNMSMFPAVAQELAAGVEPTQLSRFVVANLVQQLAAGVDPTVLLVQAIQAALAQQLLAGIEPTQLYLELFPALLQQLAAGINPDSVSLSGAQQTIDPVVLQQLLAGLAPTQLNLQLIPAIAQQLAAAVDPAIAVTLAPVLAQQLATATAPDQLNLVVLSALVEQLATGIEPTQFITQIVPAILQQLVAGLDPSVAFGITPTIVQQLVAANSPQLNMAIVTALVQQLLAGLNPAINALRIVTSGGALTVSVVDGRLAVTSVEGSASASPNTEG